MTWRPPLRETTAAPELDGDLQVCDIVNELKRLTFNSPDDFRRIKITADVRDYIVGALTRQATRRT